MDFRGKDKMIRSLFLVSLLIHTTLAQTNGNRFPAKVPAAVPAKKWPTLKGNPPLVIARGGFSGLFPEGSINAMTMAATVSVQDYVLLCNLQMTKDGFGICLTGVRLDNATSIADMDPGGVKTYNVNGKDEQGHFSVDYTMDQLASNATLNQAIYTRPTDFDGQILGSVGDALTPTNDYTPPKRFWLNVQYDAFYTQHGIATAEYVIDVVTHFGVEFLSSPEIGFLKSINGKVNKAVTKLIFKFLSPNEIEPTTKQPYGTIVKDLMAIKSFASGVMVPKDYIWPIRPDEYLGTRSTLIADAHRLGLEVYAYGFANDRFTSYNYSYDPVLEYLQFIDKGDSVDGVVTDYPITASEAVACFANNNTGPKTVKTLIITRNGASGVYPGSSDLAYQQAIDDGADIIDCSVQMTKDGVLFCSNTTDLIGDTNALIVFMSRTSNIPEIQPRNGIFSFDLTWSEISEKLKPQLVSPLRDNAFLRNPANKNVGKFVTLTDFLELAKSREVPGVLINIMNAAFLASKKNLDIVGAVSTALNSANFDKLPTQQVLIQSDDTSVLSKFKDIPAYKRVLFIADMINDVPKKSLEDIKKYADAVNIPRSSVIEANAYTERWTDVLKELKDANLTVFVHYLRNEYVTLAFDYFADPYVELATYIQSIETKQGNTPVVDGIVTDYPATASRYMRSSCSNPNPLPDDYNIYPIIPGDLSTSLVPATARSPPHRLHPLENVVDPPLPAVVTANKEHAGAPAAPAESSVRANVGNLGLSVLAILVYSILSNGH